MSLFILFIVLFTKLIWLQVITIKDCLYFTSENGETMANDPHCDEKT